MALTNITHMTVLQVMVTATKIATVVIILRQPASSIYLRSIIIMRQAI